jgi:hypothetical protein
MENCRRLIPLLCLCWLLPACGGKPETLSDPWAEVVAHLPPDVQLDDVVLNDSPDGEIVRVGQKLKQVNARAGTDGTLYDGQGREIRFFRFSVWGNPPENYHEIRRAEHEQLAKLAERYTVIVSQREGAHLVP